MTSAFLGSWISFEVSIYFAIPSQILLISPSDSNVSNSTCSWHLLLSFKIIWIVQKENQRVRKCYFVGVKKKMVMFLTFLAFRRTSRCEAQSDMSLWAFFRTTFCCSASIALFSLSFSIQHSLKMLPEYQKYLLSLGHSWKNIYSYYLSASFGRLTAVTSNDMIFDPRRNSRQSHWRWDERVICWAQSF